ncbi:MAG: Na+/H+ antiporter subunit E [Lachnospiraceae bacterium]|nr:Na+/H+ antiporter subunit E [Lachnospiraceae bacterium]
MYILFYLFWIILNGRITVEIAVTGLFVSGLLYAFMCRFMGWSVKRDIYSLKYSSFMIAYLFVLIKEIIKANLATISIIFNERVIKEPVLVSFDVDIKSPILRVLLANSITLTPGTITVSLEDNHYVVHALDESFADGIEDSVFVKMIKKMESNIDSLQTPPDKGGKR